MRFASRWFFAVIIVLGFVVLSLSFPSSHPAGLLGAATVLIVNPAARGRKRRKSKKHHAGKKRHRRHGKKRHHGGGGAHLFGAMTANPKKHRRGRKLRFHRNPIAGSVSRDLVPIALGASGAVAVDVSLGFIPMPTTGPLADYAPAVKTGAKVGLALLAGWGVGKVFGRSAGTKVLIGAGTVIVYGVLRDVVQAMLDRVAPNVVLGGLADGIGDGGGMYPELGFADGMGEAMSFNSLGEVMNVPALSGRASRLHGRGYLSGDQSEFYDGGVGEPFDQ